VLSWAAELVQTDVSQALAVALLAVIVVLPEYAVDAVFGLRAGRDPGRGAGGLCRCQHDRRQPAAHRPWLKLDRPAGLVATRLDRRARVVARWPTPKARGPRRRGWPVPKPPSRSERGRPKPREPIRSQTAAAERIRSQRGRAHWQGMAGEARRWSVDHSDEDADAAPGIGQPLLLTRAQACPTL
jgi:hypothetical protein